MALRKKSKPAGRDGSEPLFSGLKRGASGVPTAAIRRFPSPADIAANHDLRFDPANTDGKIFLGLIGAEVKTHKTTGQRAAFGGNLIGYGDDRHICTVAGNRAGKGRSLLINNLLTYPGSVIVVDPKGDLASETAHHRARSLGQRVVVLDPYAAGGEELAEFRGAFNPMRAVRAEDPDTAVVAASLIADALIVSSGERDPHWAETGKQFLEAVILHVATSPDFSDDDRTLATVHEMIMVYAEDPNPAAAEDSESSAQDADSDRYDLKRAMIESDAAQGAVAVGAFAYYSKSERERSGVISTVRRYLHFLGYPKMQAVLGNSDFELESLQNEPVTLYLSLPAMMMGACAGWLRLFVNLALDAFEANQNRREFQHQRGGHRVLMILDEAAVLQRMDRLETAIGQVAGLGVKLWTVWQDLGQAAAIYGQRWESFLGNASVLMFFGNADLYTLEYIERRLGQTLVQTPSFTTPTYEEMTKSGRLGQSFATSSHALMTAAEIAGIFDRDDPQLRQLMFLPRIGPIILQRAFYDKHEVFRGIHTGRQP